MVSCRYATIRTLKNTLYFLVEKEVKELFGKELENIENFAVDSS